MSRKSTPIGIHDFAVISALGETRRAQWQRAVSGSLAGMQPDTHYLRGRPTRVGRVQAALPNLSTHAADWSGFDYRANCLLARVLQDLESTLQALIQRYGAGRIGVVMATSTAGIDTLEAALPYYDVHQQWPAGYQTHQQRMGSVSEFVARWLGVYGPSMTVSTACSSGNKAFAVGKRWLNAGLCDVVVCGGVDVLTELTLRGFDALGALASDYSVPFSPHRQGINIGEAAAVMVLSREPAPLQLLGCGESSDAHHISAPHPAGRGAIAAMQAALADAQLTPAHMDYLNLHGTGTRQNDGMEAAAIHHVFGEAAAQLPCSSSKPQIGHTLGVSGAVELALCLLSMSADNIEGSYLPHVADGQYDPDILPLNLVAIGNTLGRPAMVMSNSFAFGGSNACVIVGRDDTVSSCSSLCTI